VAHDFEFPKWTRPKSWTLTTMAKDGAIVCTCTEDKHGSLSDPAYDDPAPGSDCDYHARQLSPALPGARHS